MILCFNTIVFHFLSIETNIVYILQLHMPVGLFYILNRTFNFSFVTWNLRLWLSISRQGFKKEDISTNFSDFWTPNFSTFFIKTCTHLWNPYDFEKPYKNNRKRKESNNTSWYCMIYNWLWYHLRSDILSYQYRKL